MIFLGRASNYRAGQTLRHLFAFGSSRDSESLQRKLALHYGAKTDTVFLYHTGRSALTAALRAIAPEGSGVVVPGLTCIAVVRAIRAAGCVPIYVDIDPKTLQYDWEALDKTLKVCYNVSIILAQNTLGLPLDVAKLESAARRYDLKIVEDLAHCAGRFYPDGREIGTIGVATVLSFGKGKAIDTISGGALVLRGRARADSELITPTRKPRRGDRWRDRWYPVLGAIIRGGYYLRLGKIFTAVFLKLKWIQRSADAELDPDVRLTHWQAKLARRQLDNLSKAAQSREHQQPDPLPREHQQPDNPPKNTPLREHTFVRERAKLLKILQLKGYYLDEIWYDAPVSPARYAAEAGFPDSECPNTLKVAAEIINYPSWYSAEQLAPVKEIVAQWKKAQAESDAKSRDELQKGDHEN